MKAKEYFEKYEDLLIHATNDQAYKDSSFNVFMDFSKESTDVIESRKAKKNTAVIAVMKEQNDKWNSLCRLFEKKYGFSPLIKDGFKTFWNRKIPGIV